MPKPKMRWLLDAFGQNVVGWLVFGGGLIAIYTVTHAIWSKLAWYELVGATCTFTSGWLFLAVLWLQRRSARLVIHEAKWGIGDVRYKNVTVMLRGHLKENAINVPVMNETFKSDPYAGVPKHLIVKYSFGRSSNKEIIRHETDQLILPEREDRATSILEGTRFAKEEGATYDAAPVTLEARIRSLCKALRAFLKEYGPEPTISRMPGSNDRDAIDQFMQTVLPWRQKFQADFRLRFADKVSRIRDEVQVATGEHDMLLGNAIATATNSPNGEIKAVEEIIGRLWDIALKKITRKRLWRLGNRLERGRESSVKLADLRCCLCGSVPPSQVEGIASREATFPS